jgi:arginine-tRNA-protein transferase
VAVGAVDITARAMNSVYFFYEPWLRQHRLGSFTILLELYYMQVLSQKSPQFNLYFSGLYNHHTPKMNYKADFEPCRLVCPVTGHKVLLDDKLKQFIN